MKRLLINLSYYNPNESGLEIYAKNILPFLKPLNPILLTAMPYSDFECYPTPKDLSSAFFWKGHLRRLKWTQVELPSIYKRLQASLLFSPIIEAPISKKIRSVITIHDATPLRFWKPFKFSPSYHRYLLPLIVKNVQHIFCNSKSTAADAVQFYKASENKITTTYLGFDHLHFQPKRKQTNKRYFLYLGRPDVNKNLTRVIDAFCALPFVQDYELWIVGKKDLVYYPPLQRYADASTARKRIHFFDYVPYADLPAVISDAVALVYPSLWEGFGLPALEAMACGTPVITSNLSALPEVVGEAGLLVDPYKTAEITNAMRRVVEEPELALQLRKAGLVQAQKFRWEFTGEATLNKLKELL
jgi:glycosyltransferase involved in cell wall biosynthesis